MRAELILIPRWQSNPNSKIIYIRYLDDNTMSGTRIWHEGTHWREGDQVSSHLINTVCLRVLTVLLISFQGGKLAGILLKIQGKTRTANMTV